MTILSKKVLEKKCSKVIFITFKISVPVIYFVIVELVALRGGNEIGASP